MRKAKAGTAAARPRLDSDRRRRSVTTSEGIALGFTVASRASRAGAPPSPGTAISHQTGMAVSNAVANSTAGA